MSSTVVGILELKYIAAMAETAGPKVAPHNPSGPIATAASVQAVAAIKLHHSRNGLHGEVPWRSLLTTPEEQFVDGLHQASAISLVLDSS